MISMVDPMPTKFDEKSATQSRPQTFRMIEERHAPSEDTARAMGWFSVGRGVAQILAPGLVGALTGVRNDKLLRLYGLRELAVGAGILNSENPGSWMWARVAGDVMDFATILEVIASGDESRMDEAALSLVAVAGATMADVMCATTLSAAKAVET